MNLVTSLAITRPPSGLSPLEATRRSSQDNQASYRIACACGSEIGRIVSEFVPEHQFWADPLLFECVSCGASVDFFDSHKHGYDGILNQFSAYEPRTRAEVVRCESCGSDRHKLIATFSYNFEDEEVEEDWSAEDRRRMPDLFDSAAFEVACAECGNEKRLSDFECA
jgi:hypothetical protein